MLFPAEVSFPTMLLLVEQSCWPWSSSWDFKWCHRSVGANCFGQHVTNLPHILPACHFDPVSSSDLLLHFLPVLPLCCLSHPQSAIWHVHGSCPCQLWHLCCRLAIQCHRYSGLQSIECLEGEGWDLEFEFVLCKKSVWWGGQIWCVCRSWKNSLYFSVLVGVCRGLMASYVGMQHCTPVGR